MKQSGQGGRMYSTLYRRRKKLTVLGIGILVFILFLRYTELWSAEAPSLDAAPAADANFNPDYIGLGLVNPAVEEPKRRPVAELIPQIHIKNIPDPHVQESQTDAEAEENFFKYLENKQVSCNSALRLGHPHDGGWNVCLSPPMGFDDNCLVYSFGIGLSWQFEDAVSKVNGCEVMAFDPSLPIPEEDRSELIHFYKVGLGTETQGGGAAFKTQPFRSHLKDHGHEKVILLLCLLACSAAGTNIHLRGGNGHTSGTVQVYHNGEWGSICDDSFDQREARVLCRMLGFESGLAAAYSQAHFGQGPGPILLDDLGCSGFETDIANCSSGGGWGKNNCGHDEDAGIQCTPTPVPQVNATTPSKTLRQGDGKTVMLQYGDSHSNFFYVCGSNFDSEAASVLCKSAGFSGGVVAPAPASVASSHPLFLHADFQGCQVGRHNDTRSCVSVSNYTGPCSSPRQLATAACFVSTGVQLSGGLHPWEGRVEVMLPGMTSSVCGEGWTDREAAVVCRMLGYSESGESRATTVYNSQSVNLTRFNCSGSEVDLQLCHVSNDTSSCPSYAVAAVHCSPVEVKDTVSFDCTPDGWVIRVNMTSLKTLYPDTRNDSVTLGGIGGCRGSEVGDELVFRASFDDCRTQIQQSANFSIYTNVLEYEEHASAGRLVPELRWRVQLQCKMARNETFNTVLRPVEGGSIGGGSHVGHFKESLQIFRDPGYQHPWPGNPVTPRVGDNVFVKVTTSASSDVRMVVRNCYARDSDGSSSRENVVLIRNGCELDPNTHVIRYADRETRFFFPAFKFSSGSPEIYLFCDVNFCNVNDQSESCRHGCHQAGKRASTRLDDSDVSVVHYVIS